MPFTFVHPVITVPLKKYGFPFSALIIGSMTPDFNYFVLKNYHIGHTVAGQFYFCLPIGILLFFLFHLILKKPFIDLLPESHARALAQIKSPDLANLKIYPSIFIALIIGSFSHILWDSFTHVDGFAVTHFNILQSGLLDTRYGTIKLYKVLQHGSTMIGGIIIFILYYKWYKTTEKSNVYNPVISQSTKILIVILITATGFSLSVIMGFRANAPILEFYSIRNFVGITIKTFIPVFLILILLYSILWNFYYRVTSK